MRAVRITRMAVGLAQAQDRFESPRELLGERLRQGSIYRLLADEGARIFPDGYFADLYTTSARGRPTVPARVLATAMVLQAFEGLSDREACDRLEVDLRWQAAAGLGTGATAFHPTVLPGQRNRLRASGRPRRLFEDTRVAARQAGAMGNRARVVDSTALYDAVATQDTVTQLRAAIRKLLVVLDNSRPELAGAVRGALSRHDDYHSPGKPPCDWDDRSAREALVDELVHDALAALGALDGAELPPPARDAADLLALVAGQDVEQGSDGRFRIAKKVAKDRVISTVDTEARHGHKSANRHFDGYKAHICIDPGSELIDEVAVTPANAPDAQAVDDLLASHAEDEDKPEVVGDSAYGSAAARSALEAQGYAVTAKAAPVRNSTGGFTKEDFAIDLGTGAVACPAGQVAPVRFGRGGEGKASFKRHCRHCPLKSQCTPSHRGRTISVHPQEALLRRVRAEQTTPEWQARYKATRPIVERKVSHFTRRPWGGRKARVRGAKRITTDVLARAAALNWARLANLGLVFGDRGWALS
jgi:IS5 family transposase